MAIDALGSQTFHLSLDVTAGIQANIAAPVPVAETLDPSDAPPIDSAETSGESKVDAAAAEVAPTPASFWSLPYVVADALAASTAEAAQAIPSSDLEIAPAEHADQHADPIAIASVDDATTDAVAADNPQGADLDETVSDVVTVPEHLPQASAAETPADAGPVALANIAIHQYQTIESPAAPVPSH